MSSADNGEALTGYVTHPVPASYARIRAALFLLIGIGGFIWLNGFLLPDYFGQERVEQKKRPSPAPEKAPALKPAPVPADRSVKAEKEPEPSESPVQKAAVSEPTIEKLTERPVLFKPGSTKLMNKDLPRIDAVARHMLENPGTRIVITGYGYRGKKLRRNRYIARQRGREIRSRLAGHDIDKKRITVKDRLMTWSKSHNDVSIHRAEMKLLEPDSDGR